MAEDIRVWESYDRIHVEWKIWGFSENLFLKKNTYSYKPYIEVNSPPFSLFNLTWRIEARSSIYEHWLKIRLCRIHTEKNLFFRRQTVHYAENAKIAGVPVKYEMEIETAYGDKYATTELEFLFVNSYESEWCKVFQSYDLNLYMKRQKYWRFAGIKDFATVTCSFILDHSRKDMPLTSSSEGSTSSSEELYLCKGTMTSPTDLRYLYHSKGTSTSLEDLKNMHLSKETATSTEYIDDKSLIKDFSILSDNFKELYISKYYTDVTINVRGKEFRAHRIILVARSRVFESMFKHDTAEKKTGLVEIPDCDPDSFEDFLIFLYAGKLDIVSAITAVNLYKTADKYDVKELKEECVRCMTRELTVDSFCDIVLLATIHNESELLKVAINFFISNLDSILPTTKWQTFLQRHPLLSNELFMKTLKK